MSSILTGILNEGISAQDLADVLYNRLTMRYPDIVNRYGHEVVGDIISDVASFHEGAEELGSSDIGGMIRQIINKLENYNIDEAIDPAQQTVYAQVKGLVDQLDKRGKQNVSNALKKNLGVVAEGEQKPGEDYKDPEEADYDDDYQDMVKRVGQTAKQQQEKKSQGVAEGEVVQFPKKHKGDLSDTHDCPKCGGDLQGGKYMGHEVKVCMPCKQVYLPPNSGIDQQGNKITDEGFDYTMKDLGNDYAGFASNHSIKHKFLARIKPEKQQLYKDKMNNMHEFDQLFQLFKVAKQRGDIIEQGVAEGTNDTIYPNAEVIKSKNGKPVGEIYQDGDGWGCFHYKADRGYDMIDSREDAIEALKDLHQETGRSRPDYTVKGVAEGSGEIKIPTEDGITMQDIRLMAGEGPLTKKTILQAIAVIRKQRREQGVAEGSYQKKPMTTHTSDCGHNYGHDCDCDGTLTHNSDCHYNYGHDCDCGLDRLKQQKQNKQQGVAEGLSKQFEIVYLDQSGNRRRKIVSGTSKEAVARQFKKQYKLEIEQVKQLEQGVAEGAPTTWEVSYDYGPHMTKSVTVKARSEEEAAAKVEKDAQRRGFSLMINSVTPAEQGVAEGVDIGQEWMSDTELDQYVPERLQQQWRELLGYDENGNPSALWANLTGGYEPDVNDPQHRRLMVKVANKWFAAKKIPNVKIFDVKDADDELEWLVQIGKQGVAEGLNEFAPDGFNGGDDGEEFNPRMAKMAYDEGVVKGASLADGATTQRAMAINDWDKHDGGIYSQYFAKGFKAGRLDKINFNNKQYNLNLKLMKDGSIRHGEQGVAEGSNDYFKRRKDEEDRIAGKKAPAKRTPRQTDYEKKRREQGVAEEKIKGADGKACWPGYRYNGTENGKDSCVKVKETKSNILKGLMG